MANLQDYVRWRGDLTLAERPFNLVDNLVLTALSNIDLDGVVPGPEDGSSVSVAEAAALHDQRDSGAHDPRRLVLVPPSLLADMAASRRFRDARLSRYVDVTDHEQGVQFAALTIALDDGTSYVAYRGTDMTIVGWKEDFVMSFETMPAQLLAAEYLQQMLSSTVGDVLVGGHSKGGNLAVYAAAQAGERDRGRVAVVYNNDGPGLGPEAAEAACLDRIADRIVRIGPQFGIVGMLFNDEPPEWIVASSARGLMQHDIMTWQVEGAGLCTEQSLAPVAVEINQAVADYLDDAGLAERREVTEAVFGSLSAGGAVLLQDLSSGSSGGVELVLLSLLRSRGQLRKPVRHGLQTITRAVTSFDYAALFRQAPTIRLVTLGLIGLFLLSAPELGAQVLGVVAVAGLLALAVWWLGKLGLALARRFKLRRTQVIMLGAGLLLALGGLVLLASLFLTVNLFAGACFIVGVWGSIRAGLAALNATPRMVPRGVALFVNAGVALLFGVVALTTPEAVASLFIEQVGRYLLVVAVVGLFLALWDGVTEALTRQ